MQLLTDINVNTQLYTRIYSCVLTLACANRYIQPLTDINMNTKLYIHIYSCICTLACANKYIQLLTDVSLLFGQVKCNRMKEKRSLFSLWKLLAAILGQAEVTATH